MTFLNGLLAFGAAAFTIPLIIHLLHRSKFQTVQWGAMHLLQASRNVNSRRIQWQQLLLLLLRCLIPVLLAFAMSRPLLQSWLSSGNQTAVSLAIVLDDSLSMFAADEVQKDEQAAAPGVRTRFATACDTALELLNTLPSGSEAAIVLAGSKPLMLAPHTPEELGNQLRQLQNRKQPAGGLVADTSIREALQWLGKSTNPKRQIVVVSDFQSEDWPLQLDSQNGEAIELIKKQVVVPELAMLRVGQSIPSSTEFLPTNLSIDAVAISPSLIAAERETTIIATLNNHGPSTVDGVRVAVFANDFEIDRQEVSLAPNASVQMRSRWTPQTSGLSVVRVQLLRDDGLLADNSRSQIAVVRQMLPVLLMDGDRRNESMQSESDFLRVAMSPFSLLQGQKGDLFVTKTIHPHELTEVMLNDYRAVVLCNVAELSEPQQNWLRDFAKRGNGLVFFLGDRVRADQYQTWPTVVNNGLRLANFLPRLKLPLAQKGSETSATAEPLPNKEVESGLRVKTQQVEFPPVREMSNVSLNSLSQTRFEHRMPMSLEPTAAVPPFNANVAMRFEDDEPWIIQCSLGEGRCVWIDTACDAGDSNFPSRPAFVPFVQKLVAYVSKMESSNLTIPPGAEWRSRIVRANKKNPGQPTVPAAPVATLPSQVTIWKPDEKNQIVEVDKEGNFLFADTRLLGQYLVKTLQSNENPIQDTNEKDSTKNTNSSGESKKVQELVAAVVVGGGSADLHESDLKSWNEDELKQLGRLWSATTSTSTKELLNAARSDWHGREVWMWIWSALVVCFLAEIFVEQWLAPRRSSHLAAPKPITGGLAS